MAVAALRIAVSQLPSGSVSALAAALRPSTPRHSSWASSQTTSTAAAAAAALRVAAVWLPQGTPSAAALAAVAGRGRGEQHLQLIVPCVERTCCSVDPTTAAAALAVAAQQQPRGTSSAFVMSTAAGRAFLEAQKLSPCGYQTISVTVLALAVAAGRLSPQMAAVLEAVSRTPRRRRGGSCPTAMGPRQQPTSFSDETSGQTSRSGDSLLSLCQDTLNQVFGQLWPLAHTYPCAQKASLVPPSDMGKVRRGSSSTDTVETQLSARTFETRLRQSGIILNDLCRVSAVSHAWARRADKDGFPSAHAYLYEIPGTKGELQQRYSRSKRQLLVKDWLLGYSSTHSWAHTELTSGVDSVVSRIAEFMP